MDWQGEKLDIASERGEFIADFEDAWAAEEEGDWSYGQWGMTYSPLEDASESGNIDQLNAMLADHLTKGAPLDYTEQVISLACREGRLNVLEWWLTTSQEHGFELKCSPNAANNASYYGHTDILDWLYENTKFSYTHYALDKTDSVDVLNWWLKMSQDHGVELLYTTDAVDIASTRGNLPVLEWWWHLHTLHQREFRYTENAIDEIMCYEEICDTEIIAVLDWWLKIHLHHGIPLLYTADSLDNASTCYSRVIKWWFTLQQTYGKDFLYTEACFDNFDTCNNSHQETLEFYHTWQELHEKHNVPIKFTLKSINNCIDSGSIECLDWWIYMYTTHHLPVNFTKKSLKNAINKGIKVVEWMYRQHQLHGFLFHCDDNVLVYSSLACDIPILEMLRQLGYVKECPEYLIDNLTSVKVIQWWWDHCDLYKYPFTFTHQSIDNKFMNEAITQYNWFFHAHQTYGIPFLYTHRIIDILCSFGNIEALDWWAERAEKDGVELLYSVAAMDRAAVEALEWWKKMHAKGFELKYTNHAMDIASLNETIGHLDWWKQQQKNGIELRFTREKIKTYSPKVIAWWNESGLLE